MSPTTLSQTISETRSSRIIAMLMVLTAIAQTGAKV